jgi:WD40 repeat protein
VILWDALTGQKKSPIPHPAFRLIFAPDGATLAIGTSGSIVLWDVTKKEARTVFQVHNGPVWSLMYSPQPQLLASGGCSQDVVVWDVAQGDERAIFRSPSIRTLIAFSHDGKTLASGVVMT